MQVLEELPDAPLFANLPQMCSTLRLSSPKLEAYFSALVRQGAEIYAEIYAEIRLLRSPPGDRRSVHSSAGAHPTAQFSAIYYAQGTASLALTLTRWR